MSDATVEEFPGATISDEEAERLARLATDIMEGRADFAAVVGLKTEELEGIYSLGHGLYEGGKYDEAEDVFRFLSLHRHLDARFWMGLGACQQMQKKLREAVKSYGMGALVAPLDPQLSLRAGECFMALGDRSAAKTALEAAVLAAGTEDAKQPFGRRAQMILDTMGGKGAA